MDQFEIKRQTRPVRHKPIAKMTLSERKRLWRRTKRLSDLLEIAVRDAMWIKKTGWRSGAHLNMSAYVRLVTPGNYCAVCLAGAQLYRDEGARTAPSGGIGIRHRLVDGMRVGGANDNGSYARIRAINPLLDELLAPLRAGVIDLADDTETLHPFPLYLKVVKAMRKAGF